jgi:DnaJ-class molecular chaperone
VDRHKKAWEQPSGWKPKNPCPECEGDGYGHTRTFRGNEMVDWDDCVACGGTGEVAATKTAKKGAKRG